MSLCYEKHRSFVCTGLVGCAAERRTLRILVLVAFLSRWESIKISQNLIERLCTLQVPLITRLDPTWKVQ